MVLAENIIVNAYFSAIMSIRLHKFWAFLDIGKKLGPWCSTVQWISLQKSCSIFGKMQLLCSSSFVFRIRLWIVRWYYGKLLTIIRKRISLSRPKSCKNRKLFCYFLLIFSVILFLSMPTEGVLSFLLAISVSNANHNLKRERATPTDLFSASDS